MTARKRPSAADYLAELGDDEKPRKGKASTPATSEKKRKISLYFRESLLEEARSAVLALGSNDLEPSNLSRLFGEALEEKLVRLRKKFNDGEPFPPTPLFHGRPLHWSSGRRTVRPG